MIQVIDGKEQFGFIDISNDHSLSPLLHNGVLDYTNQTPDAYPFDIYAAYRIKLLSLINGAINVLRNEINNTSSPQPSPPSTAWRRGGVHEKITALYELAELKLKQLEQFKRATQGRSVKLSREFYKFYSEELPQACGLKPEQIALGEAFYIWQEIPRPTRITRYQKGTLVIIQEEHPRHSTLTHAQKIDLLSIHSATKPLWFTHLQTWAQNILQRIVPQELAGDWTNYERCHPCMLRTIPGEANATTHHLKILQQTENGLITLSDTTAHRQGVPSSYHMKNEAQQNNSANENVRQMLDDLLLKNCRTFNDAWGTRLKLPIVLCGLLTPTAQSGQLNFWLEYLSLKENDTKLCNHKHTATSVYTRQNRLSAQLFNLNVPINGILSHPVNPDTVFIKYLNTLQRTLKSTLDEQTRNNSVPEEIINARKQRWAQLKLATTLLTDLKDQKLKGRNRNLYLAALYDVTTRLMHGLSTGNCRSSRDRKGTELIMADAMLIYSAERMANNEGVHLPEFADQSPERKRFVDIFCQLYASGHQFLVASDNSPGALGIKNEAYLDQDILENLQRMQKHGTNVFHQSKEIAELGAPGGSWKKLGESFKNNALGLGLLVFGCTPALFMLTGLLPTIIISTIALLGLIAGKIADIIDHRRDRQQSFEGQVGSERSISGSTGMMPWGPRNVAELGGGEELVIPPLPSPLLHQERGGEGVFAEPPSMPVTAPSPPCF